MFHRSVIFAFALGHALLGAASAYGQAYPNKAVRIVTSAAGGSGDIVARLVAQGISTPLGQPVIVENRGGGVIPPQIVTQSSTDGYTLLLYGNSLWLAPLLQNNVPYDPIKDFAPVTFVARSPQVMVVHASIPVKSVKEFIAYGKTLPGGLNFGSAANGSSAHLAGELFKSMTGVNLVHIPYKSSATALNDLLAGQVQLMFATTVSVSPLLKSGKLTPLAVTSAEPSPLIPDLPTIASSGLPGYEAVTIQGVFAPAKTPAPVIARLHNAIKQALDKSEIKERFATAGVEPVGGSPQQFAAAIKSDLTTMGKVIKDAGIREE